MAVSQSEHLEPSQCSDARPQLGALDFFGALPSWMTVPPMFLWTVCVRLSGQSIICLAGYLGVSRSHRVFTHWFTNCIPLLPVGRNFQYSSDEDISAFLGIVPWGDGPIHVFNCAPGNLFSFHVYFGHWCRGLCALCVISVLWMVCSVEEFAFQPCSRLCGLKHRPTWRIQCNGVDQALSQCLFDTRIFQQMSAIILRCVATLWSVLQVLASGCFFFFFMWAQRSVLISMP